MAVRCVFVFLFLYSFLLKPILKAAETNFLLGIERSLKLDARTAVTTCPTG